MLRPEHHVVQGFARNDSPWNVNHIYVVHYILAPALVVLTHT